jgi:CelD/BcsL family acetyltransferase involved in cellulose biosynthesis
LEPVRRAVCVYDNPAMLAPMLPAWEELLAACPDASIFSTWEWLGSWWEAFGDSRRLHVVAFWGGDGRLEALAPMAIGTESLAPGVRMSCLHLMGDGSGDSDNLGFLVRPGFEAEFAEALLDHLESHAESWDIARFNTVDPNARWVNRYRNLLTRHRWSTLALARPWLVVTLPPTWEAYLMGLSSKERGKIGTRTRRLEKRYTVGLRRCADKDTLVDGLETLFHLHGKRWQARGQSGSFGSEYRRRFYRSMAGRFLSRGWLDLTQLTLNEKVVATQFSFRFGGTEFSLQEGYDPDFSPDSVGYVLRALNLRRLIAEGTLRYDFLAGRDASKERWGAHVAEYVDINFARRRSLGAVQLGGMRGTIQARRWWQRRPR